MTEHTAVGMMAYQGKEGCRGVTCRTSPESRAAGRCEGWHCANCDRPSSYQGHVVGNPPQFRCPEVKP